MNELSPEARAIVDMGRPADDPAPTDRTRLRGAIMASIAATGGLVGGTATASAATAGTSMLAFLAKIVAGIAVMGAVGGGLYYGVAHRHGDAAPVASTTVVESAAPNDLAASVDAPIAPAPTASATESAASDPLPTQPLASARARPSSTSAPSEDTLAAETRHLREVQSALNDGHPERAMALLDEPSAAFQKGELGEERAAARVIALCKLGRVGQAKAAAAAFLRKNPRSMLADRVRAACP